MFVGYIAGCASASSSFPLHACASRDVPFGPSFLLVLTLALPCRCRVVPEVRTMYIIDETPAEIRHMLCVTVL